MIIVKLVTKTIAYSLLMVINIMLAVKFYEHGMELATLMYGTVSVLWMMALITFVTSLVLKEAMK